MQPLHSVLLRTKQPGYRFADAAPFDGLDQLFVRRGYFFRHRLAFVLDFEGVAKWRGNGGS